MNPTKIALISATPLAIAPAASAIDAAFPDSTVWNLLDDRLLADAQAEGGITEPLAARMDQLIAAALAGGADGVLLTCSQYGARAQLRDPETDGVAVLSADGPLFDEAVALRPSRVLLVASLESAAADSGDRLAAAFAEASASARISPLVVPSAAKPLAADALTEQLVTAVTSVEEPYDLIVLAQYSLAPAAAALAARFGVPVLDGPSAAARRLAAEIGRARG
ncbi:hypothetical protein [Agrococcus sp. DT81.2]|uniref:hypothetical protein n=1 Tax=Agrococcus sp. DT81.2 TaxID=3393414 RepID=UPI003CE534AA